MRPETPPDSADSCCRSRPVRTGVPRAGYIPCTRRRRPEPPDQRPRPKSIACCASPSRETPLAARARPRPAQAWSASANVIHGRARAAASGSACKAACGETRPARPRGRAAARHTKAKSFRQRGFHSGLYPCSCQVLSSDSSHGEGAVLSQRLPQFMPCPQEHDPYKLPADTQGVRNFVVTHIRVVAHHQRHSCAHAQGVQSLAHLFAGAFLDQLFQLIRLRAFQRNVVHIIHVFIVASFPAAQHVPAMIGGNFVQPGSVGPRLVVLAEVVAQLHKNLHRGVFRVFARRHRPPAKAEDCRGKFPVQFAPSLGIPSPGSSDYIRRLRFSRCAHSPWSQRFHKLVRGSRGKTITSCNVRGVYALLGARAPMTLPTENPRKCCKYKA